MAEKKVLTAVRSLEKGLRDQGLNISKLIVFGSHAKGTAREDSDIDVVIVSKDFRGKNILERARMTREPEIQTIEKYLIPLDIMTLTPGEMKTSLIAGYAKEGIVISPRTKRRNGGKKAAAG